MQHISSDAACGSRIYKSNEVPAGTGDPSGSFEGALNGKVDIYPKWNHLGKIYILLQLNITMDNLKNLNN